MSRERIDRLLVARGFFESRSMAQAAIADGLVAVEGRTVEKPSEQVPVGATIQAEAPHPYVSRGGVKLAHALDVFGVDVTGLNALDIGASTGGFSDVLLRRGAARVVAVDVGRDQLHPKLKNADRLVSLEQTDARSLTPDLIGVPPELIVCDASFISLTALLEVPLGLAASGAQLVALFKPQFEVGRPHVGKGGIVRDVAAVQAAEARLADWLGARGWSVSAWCDSPIAGGDGNRERLVFAELI